MKIYKYKNGKCNLAGTAIKERREKMKKSQEQLVAELQLLGLDITQKAISRIETGDRVIPDYELLYFSEVLHISVLNLLKTNY